MKTTPNCKSFSGGRIVVLLASLLWVSVLPAGVIMKQSVKTDAFEIMGQTRPAQEMIQTIYIGESRMRADNEKVSMIIYLDDQKMMMLNHEKKTVTEIPLQFGQSMKDSDSEKAKSMQNMLQMSLKITPTDQTRTIDNRTCRKYLQVVETGMGKMESEMWVTDELKMDYQKYAKFMAAMMAKQPGMKQSVSDMLEEMKKINGVAVLSVSKNTIMGTQVQSTTRLLEFKRKDIPSGTFDVPNEYQENTF